MNPSDFRQIDNYFNAKGKQELAGLAYVIYVENVEDALKRITGTPTATQVRQICDNYLTDAQLKNYVSVVEKAEETRRQKNNNSAISFWASVWSSIVANLIFAVILYAFYIAVVSPSSNQVFDETRHTMGNISNTQ